VTAPTVQRTVLTTTSAPRALLATARPRQWIKNALVLAAPGVAGVLLRPGPAAAAGLALLAFTLAAVATYFVNDAADVAADRLHPVKVRRAVASGLVGVRTARLTGAGIGVLALVVAFQVTWPFGLCVAAYLALTLAYSAALKHVPVLEVLIVAAGFLLRVAGGALATRVAVSSWFLLMVGFGSLYLVTAKRAGELSRTHTRRVVAGYSMGWLQQTMTMALTGAAVAYAAWAFQYRGPDVWLPLLASSVVPFLAALMRYNLLVSRGDGETPENLLTADPFLLIAGAIWTAAAGGAIYLA
jgi:decaprenyl-phosphate phosphoribosyltransferase